MKSNLLKRIGAVALAVAVSLTMGVTSFAANTDDTTKQNTSKGIVTTDNSVSIAKQIVFVNAENTNVREPNIVYTYTIDTTQPGSATITDADSITKAVTAGPLAAVTGAATATTSTVTFADTNTSAASSGGTSTASKYATFTFDPTKFSEPGIYRYKITESTNVEKATVGITETETYAKVRYLDVYVQKNTAGTAREIYGYVLFKGTDTTAITSANVTMKSQGYVNAATSGQSDVDVYKTQNLHIAKTTTGAMADVQNNFPIALAFTNVTATPKVDVVVNNGGVIDGATTEGDTSYIKLSTSITGTVKNESTIDLKGIPEGTTVSLEETNNTTDSYKVKAGTSSDTENLLTEATIAPNGKAGPTTAQTLSEKRSIFITNTLDSISPTNVVMRFAPFLFIFGAAILLLVVMRRRRTHDAE